MKHIIYKAGYVLFLLLFFLLMMAETSYLNNKNIFFEKSALPAVFFGSLGLFLFVKFFPNQFNNKQWRRVFTSLKVILVLLLLFLLVSEASIVNFSGMTFGTEVFHHLEWQAFVLGVKEYSAELLAFLLFMLIIAVAISKSLVFKTIKQQSAWFLAGIVLLVFFIQHTVVGRFYSGLQEYHQSRSIPVSQVADVNMFNHLGIQASTITKNEIKVKQGNNKNLIIVYLESFSHFFTNSDAYPKLTPNINSLKKQHGELSNYYSNAGFTIDGLISSNCGFIPNMALGNNSLLGADRPYFLLPCATDVLAKAGYHQEFIGGAKKSFSNKERFLLDHGFDKVWGWEDFEKEQRFQAEGTKSWWGLHDEDLFDIATQRIIDLQGSKPFHLSILTISTHLNGFSSPSCKKYKGKDDCYINAIHCLDQLLGKFVKGLQEKDLLKNSILLITADHGVFNSTVIQKLFTKQINPKRILGIVMDGNNHNIEEPIALYDMGPAVLNMLEIEHNVRFIFGKGFQHHNPQRMLFSKHRVYQEGKWQAPKRKCQTLNPILPVLPIDFCELKHIIKTVHGFTGSFGLISGVAYNSESSLNISFSEDAKKIQSIELNSDNLLNNFRRNGFILEPQYLSRKGVFMIFFNLKEHKLYNMFNFKTQASDLVRIATVIKANRDVPFIVFSNKLEKNLEVIKTIKEKHALSCVTEYFCMNKIGLLGKVTLKEHQINLSFLMPEKQTNGHVN
ncbi:MAG: LTA synthase family protein [Proteobacteria bacterium]|nr:LTA synthase family protein [Pseudomonadota bacterium]